MQDKMIRILQSFHQYNAQHMASLVFGFDEETVYDALVIAPTYTPYKLKMEELGCVTLLREGSCNAAYLIEANGMKIAWVKTGTTDANVIDHLALCAELQFEKLIFVGAVGALKADFLLGDLCTPSYSIDSGYALTYLKESIRDHVPFEKIYPDRKFVDRVIALCAEKGDTLKPATVFCTPSVALEYTHLDEIRSFDTDLIEMETAAFYTMSALLEVPAIALLVVSDNSASGTALIGRTEEEEARYDHGRKVILPRVILRIAAMD